MDRFAAHYIFTGEVALRKAVLAKNDQHKIVSLSAQDAMAIEFSNTIFFNGIMSPKFVSFNEEINPPNYTVLNAHSAVPSFYILPTELLIRFKEDELNKLFAFLVELQLKWDYSLFDLLKVLTCNNILAQEINPPIIEIGKKVSLVLLTKLNLVDGLFTSKTHLRQL